MKDISAMEWENEAAKCRLSFQGDTWEMEDHRNWTDSSFKTFCTPLSIPYPVTIQAGTEVEQTVLFKAYPLKSISKVNPGIVTITPEITPLRLPLIGVGLNGELTTREAGILRLAGLHHLRHDLKFSDQNWEDQLKDAASNAVSAGVGLELVLHFTEHIESNKASLQEVIQGHPIPVRRIWAIQEKTRLSHSRLISLTCSWMKEMFPDALAGGGTDAYFAEFNRNRFDAGDLDFVTFAVSPQVHAFDNDSLVENLEAQCDVLLSAQLLYPGKGLQVSPVTLKQRFNVVANGEETPLPEDQLPYPVDARQMSLFAAGWTLGSILSLARGGAGSVTFYQTTGWQGIIQGDADPAKPDLFAGRKGEIFPVYHVLRLICGLHDAVIVPYRTVPALKCTALAIEQQHQVLLLVANHTRDTLPLHLEGFKPDEFAVWDHSNLELSYHDAEFLDHLQFNKMSNVSLKVAPFSFYLLRKFL
jgi:hypothetical protein